MKSEHKLTAIFLIWAAFVGACLFTFAGRSIGIEHVFMALFFAIAVTTTTRMIMEAPLPEEQATVKSKSSKVDRMLSRLSDEEMEQLRQRISDDGELVSLDEVMRERES